MQTGKIRYSVVCALLIVSLSGLIPRTVSAQLPDKAYSLAIVPQYSPLDVHQAWSPVLEHIRNKSRISISLVTYDGFAGFINDLKKGKPDLAYMAPYHLVRARQQQGYIPLLRSNKQPLHGLLVVPQNSPIQDLRGLKGARIAFPSPNAFAASLYLRAHLNSKGIKYQPAYVKNHSNVYRLVAQHNNTKAGVEAGGGVNLSIARQSDEMREQLRIIYKTPPLVTHPVCSHPRVPKKDRQIITKAIMELATTEDGRKMLDAIQLSMPVITQYKEYMPIEKLKLERLMMTN